MVTNHMSANSQTHSIKRKGRAGRKAHYEEWGVTELVGKSISILRQFLNDESQPLEKRADVAVRFAVKLMPDKVEHSLKIVSLTDSMLQRISTLLAPKATAIEYEVLPEASTQPITKQQDTAIDADGSD